LEIVIAADSKTWEGAVHLPRVRLRATATIVEVNGDGLVCELKIQSASVDEKSLDKEGQYFKSKIGGLAGTLVRVSVSTTGALGAVVSTPPANADPAGALVVDKLETALNHMFVALPESPIGTGARWRTRSVIDQAQVRIDSDSQLEAVSVSTTQAVIDRVTTLSAPKRTVSQNGLDIEISNVSGTMRTHTTLKAGDIAPTATGTYESSMTFRAKERTFVLEESSTVEIRPIR
jgi:hypothetical protein